MAKVTWASENESGRTTVVSNSGNNEQPTQSNSNYAPRSSTNVIRNLHRRRIRRHQRHPHQHQQLQNISGPLLLPTAAECFGCHSNQFLTNYEGNNDWTMSGSGEDDGRCTKSTAMEATLAQAAIGPSKALTPSLTPPSEGAESDDSSEEADVDVVSTSNLYQWMETPPINDPRRNDRQSEPDVMVTSTSSASGQLNNYSLGIDSNADDPTECPQQTSDVSTSDSDSPSDELNGPERSSTPIPVPVVTTSLTNNNEALEARYSTPNGGNKANNLTPLTSNSREPMVIQQQQRSNDNSQGGKKSTIVPSNQQQTTPPNMACVVCGDKSSGKHYGQFTCEGCKSFFKRSIRRNMHYTCRNSKHCPVDVHHRNQCQFCRLKKCFGVGMRKEAVQRGRLPPGMHSYPTSFLSTSGDAFLNSQNHLSTFITQLMNAEPYTKFGAGYLSICPGVNVHQGGLLGADHLGELSARLLLSTVGWAKNLHIFKDLELPDQATLLCSAWSDIFLLNVAQSNMILPTSTFLAVSGLHAAPVAGDRVILFMEQIRLLKEKVEKIKALRMDAAEYACLKAIILFTPDAYRLSDPSRIELLQEKAQLSLEEYCKQNYPNQSQRFGKLLLRLPSLKSVGGPLVEQLFFTRTVGKTPVDTVIRDMVYNDTPIVSPPYVS